MTIHDQITWILIQNSKYGQIPRRAVVWFHPRGLQALSLHCFGRGAFFQSGTVRRVANIPSDLMQACRPDTVESDGLDTFHVPQQQTGDAHGK